MSLRIGSKLTTKDVDEMMNEADKDRDGQVGFEGELIQSLHFQ